ncbi:MAG: hypothetical protein J6I37_09560 [Prevotella sp.]|nr:hypothetical protein [Prevotella sp.]
MRLREQLIFSFDSFCGFRNNHYICSGNQNDYIMMGIKKITREDALRRWKHSLEIKREWERKVTERWAKEDQQKIVIV